MSGASVKELPASPSVGLPGIPVTDRGSEKVNVGFSNFRAGSCDQLRDPRVSKHNVRVEAFGLSADPEATDL